MIDNHHALKASGEAWCRGPAHAWLRNGAPRRRSKGTAGEHAGRVSGQIANSPIYTFTGYWKAETPNVRGGWYITGDTMIRDEDSYFSFVGRNVRFESRHMRACKS